MMRLIIIVIFMLCFSLACNARKSAETKHKLPTFKVWKEIPEIYSGAIHLGEKLWPISKPFKVQYKVVAEVSDTKEIEGIVLLLFQNSIRPSESGTSFTYHQFMHQFNLDKQKASTPNKERWEIEIPNKTLKELSDLLPFNICLFRLDASSFEGESIQCREFQVEMLSSTLIEDRSGFDLNKKEHAWELQEYHDSPPAPGLSWPLKKVSTMHMQKDMCEVNGQDFVVTMFSASRNGPTYCKILTGKCKGKIGWLEHF